MYAIHHLRLIEKPVMDFLLVLTELFSLDVRAEALQANIDWKSPFMKGRWVSLVQNFRYKGASPTNHSLCRKFRCIIISYGVNWAEVFIVLLQFMRLTDGWTDGQTDGPLIAISRLHS